MVAEYQRETAIKAAHNQAEVQKIFANWPLTLPPAQILESYNNSLIPLRIFIAPLKFSLNVLPPRHKISPILN